MVTMLKQDSRIVLLREALRWYADYLGETYMRDLEEAQSYVLLDRIGGVPWMKEVQVLRDVEHLATLERAERAMRSLAEATPPTKFFVRLVGPPLGGPPWDEMHDKVTNVSMLLVEESGRLRFSVAGVKR